MYFLLCLIQRVNKIARLFMIHRLALTLLIALYSGSSMAQGWSEDFKSIMFQTLNNHGFNIRSQDMSCFSMVNLACNEKENPDGYSVRAYNHPIRVIVYRGFLSSKMLACFTVVDGYLKKSSNLDECKT